MLDELREMLQSIEDSRALIICHPDDEASIRLAVSAIAIVAPRIQTNRWMQPGQAVVFPDPSAHRTIIP